MLRELEEDGDPEITQNVMRAFLDNTPDLLETLRRGAGVRDADTMRTASHTLKSTSAIVGAVSLSACCAGLEALARAGGIDEAIALVDEVMREYQDVRRLVEELIVDTAACSADG